MKKLIKNKKGFSLLELIVVVSIIGLVITTIMGILIFGYQVFGKTTVEHSLQTQVKLSLEQISEMVRESRAVFAVPDTGYFDDEWNYIAVSEDGKMIQSLRWNHSTETHDVKVLVGPFDDVTFSIGFDKQNSMSKDNTLRMFYEAYTKDGTVKRFDIKSGYVAFNALQVVDYGTADNPAKVLAYRSDDFAYENYDLIVNIAMILDVSGSMDTRLGSSTRMIILREKAKELVQQLAQNKNDNVSIDISLVPFSYHANDPTGFYSIKNTTQRNSIISKIDGLRASGNTNTGDGIRRAYYQLVNKQADDLSEIERDTIVKNYVIILVDGESNTRSVRAQHTSSWFGLSRGWTNISLLLEDGNVLADNYRGTAGQYYNIYYRNSVGATLANQYVQAVGELISDPDMFTNYFIAFANEVGAGEITLIANAANIPSDRVFLATSDDELGLSFTDIQLSITNDIWHFLGPKLVP